jgi:hypothetical protein
MQTKLKSNKGKVLNIIFCLNRCGAGLEIRLPRRYLKFTIIAEVVEKENGIGQEYKKNIVGSAWECNDHL